MFSHASRLDLGFKFFPLVFRVFVVLNRRGKRQCRRRFDWVFAPVCLRGRGRSEVMVDDTRARKPSPPASRAFGGGAWRRAAMRTWILRVGSSILIWTAVMQLTSVWQPRLPKSWPPACFDRRGGAVAGQGNGDANANLSVLGREDHALSGSLSSPPALLPRSESRSLLLLPLLPLLHQIFIFITV